MKIFFLFSFFLSNFETCSLPKMKRKTDSSSESVSESKRKSNSDPEQEKPPMPELKKESLASANQLVPAVIKELILENTLENDPKIMLALKGEDEFYVHEQILILQKCLVSFFSYCRNVTNIFQKEKLWASEEVSDIEKVHCLQRTVVSHI